MVYANFILGIPQEQMIKNVKGEIVYNADVDTHFPHLTVRQTLEFAAALRTPSNRIVAASRKENIQRVVAVVMAICGLTHTRNTKVGNDYIRGVSGGERKV
jgi:ATP-binding cassette, subfamily G (WHITE), member 2, PDR